MSAERQLAVLDPSLYIDRDSYEPAYAQLVNVLRRLVASGVLLPGDKLPSESEIRRHFDVSPMTVRRAINILSDQGVVTTLQGKGTFVKPIELGEATFDLQNMQDLFARDDTAVKMLDARVVAADERTARKLALAVGARVVYLRRLITRSGEPFFYQREFLIYDPTRPLIEAELEVTSLRGLFDGTGGTGLKRGDLRIEAATLKEDEARLLKSETGRAALILEHTFFDFDDHPTSWGWFICRADMLHFSATIGIR